MTKLPMRPVEIWLFRATNGGDARQVPAAGATISVRFQGVTVSTAVTCPTSTGGTAVSVGGSGRVAVGDQLQVGTDSTKLLRVKAHSAGPVNPQTLNISAESPASIALAAGDRLLVNLRFPTLFADSAGLFPIPGNNVTIDSKGYARFYCAEANVDYVASGGGLATPLLFADVQAGWASSVRPTLNVLDFPTFQAAHDALPLTGGTIHVPAGLYDATSSPCAFTGLVATKPLALVGESNGFGSSLSKLVHNMPNAANIDAIFLNRLGGFVLRGLHIQGPGTAGTGRGIRWYVLSSAGVPSRMAGVTIENVIVEDSANLAFEFLCDGRSVNYVSKLEMLGCKAINARSGGSLFLGGAGTNNNVIDRCEFNGPGFGAIFTVPQCTVTNGQNTVTAPHPAALPPAFGDVVSGMGIEVGTVVNGISTANSVITITLSKPAIESPAAGTTTVLSFYRASGIGPFMRGHVHLQRNTITRFQQCSFLGPADSPALSTELVSNDLELRDTYRRSTGTSATAHSFFISGTTNVLIDGLFQQSGPDAGVAVSNLLLMTGPQGMRMGRVTNAQLVILGSANNADVIVLSNPSTDELLVDNASEFGPAVRRDLAPFSSPIAPAGIVSVPSAATLVLPNPNDEAFLVSGSATITAITPYRPNRAVTLIFTGTATVTDGGNLKLFLDYSGGADRTLTLVCDGTNWYEQSRSTNA